MAVPFHVPVTIVPRVARFMLPAHVDKAVFSTRESPNVDLVIPLIALETARVVGYLVLSGDVKLVALLLMFSGVNPKVFCFHATTVVNADKSFETVVTDVVVAFPFN